MTLYQDQACFARFLRQMAIALILVCVCVCVDALLVTLHRAHLAAMCMAVALTKAPHVDLAHHLIAHVEW